MTVILDFFRYAITETVGDPNGVYILYGHLYSL